MNKNKEKSFECKGLRIAFQNVNSINPQKLAHIVGQLRKFDIILLSEVNSPNSSHDFSFANNDSFDFHFDPSVRRIAVVASKIVDISTVGIGIKLEQTRVQKDKTAVQSFVYKVKSGKTTVFIENVYAIPNLCPGNIKKLCSHFDDQAKKFQNYIVGGDMNLNWLEEKTREFFLECSSIRQRIKDYTRICRYASGDNFRTSRTIIDLIFCNTMIDNSCHSPKSKLMSKLFDHNAVSISIFEKSYNFFRDVTYFKNPLNRPLPSSEQVKEINERIDKIPNNECPDYDSLIVKTRTILNDIVPNNPAGPSTKRFYKTPLTKSLLFEIRQKRRLFRIKDKTDEIKQKIKAQCNKVTALKRKVEKEYLESLIQKSRTPEAIHKTIKFIQSGEIATINNNPEKITIKGVSGQSLVEKSAEFFRKRAVDLVPEEKMVAAGTPVPALRPEESLPLQFDFDFPEFEEFNEYIPKNKVSNSAGPDGISSAILERIWPSFKVKLNDILADNELQYPYLDNGYYQRSIPKKSGEITELKQLRPLGVLNPVPKYNFNKPFFKSLRDHLEPIFINRNNYSYRGTHQCIIRTFDEVISRIDKKEKVVMVKYDFSNAFGTIHHAAVLDVFRQLNLSDKTLNYISQYLENQRTAETVISDKSGMYISKKVDMSRGSPQGQVGADLVFIVQQFILRELCSIFRSMYVDDLNDIVSDSVAPVVIDLVKENEAQLVRQSHQAGFALNDDKTTYIPHNIDDHELTNAGLKITRSGEKCEVLGFPYEATKKGFDVKPASDMIIKRLNFKAPSIHSSRTYFSNPETRKRIATSLIYQCIGELHLVLAYDTKKDFHFNRIRVKVNDLIRATGLRNTTPSDFLDKVFGTNLKEFAEHGIILNGLKSVSNDPDFFDRTFGIRHRFPKNTYMSKFVKLWNDLPYGKRKIILECKNMNQVKRLLKKERQLEYDPAIHTKYKWISYKN